MKNASTTPLLLFACVCGFLLNPLAAQPGLVIQSFAASPTVTNPGTVTNLSWSVSNATSISMDQGVGDVTGANSIYLSPVQTTTYTLTASAGSSSVTQQVTVTVVDTPAPVFGNGRTFYVSPSGSDSNSGLSAASPWQTVAKVNSTNLQPGDTVLFQRGGEWHESLFAPSSGLAGNPISFADYGTGAKPKFWGSNVLINALFVPAGNGLYTYSISTPVTAALVNHTFFLTSPANDASGLANSWSYSGTTLTINSQNSDPRTDGKVYTAVVRQDAVYSNFMSHLVFRNLVADETAAANQGYGFRIQNSTDVLVDSCEAYRAAKHHFASINSTQVVGQNLYAAWAMPGQSQVGATIVDPAVSAYVSFGDNTIALPTQTSVWRNCVWDHPIDPQSSINYYAFYTHGSNITSVLLDNMSSLASNLTVNNSDNPSAAITIKGGLIQNAQLEAYGQGILVDGMHITGPYGSIRIGATASTFQNLLIEGSYLVNDPYQSAVVSLASGNTLRFNTIVLDPRAAGSYACLTLDSDSSGTSSQGAHLQYYGNICISPQTALKQWDFYSASADFAQAQYNLYASSAGFAQAQTGGGFNSLTFSQWQGLGMDTASLQGDPMFVNAAQSNYNLLPGSPAINAALLPVSLLTANPPIPTDQAGNPRLEGNAFDMGALESTGSLSSSWTITSVAGTPQTATVNAGFAAALQAKVVDSTNNPVIGVTVTFTNPSSGASAAFSGSATATGITDASGIATSPALTANGQQGGYIVTATALGAAAVASFSLTNSPVLTGGALSGSGTSAATPFNLTAEGTADWVHWGDTALNRKKGVSPQISSYGVVGSGPAISYSNDPRALSWTDGTPSTSGSNSNGVYVNFLQNGFSFTAPADGTVRNLTIHLGGWFSGGTLRAHLSDSSASDYLDITTPVNGPYDRNYTLTYSSALPAQTLKVSWVMTSGTGNVTLNGAALSVAGPTISATAGTAQSATVNTAFLTPLQATLKDSNNNPMSGVAVNFAAPTTGASVSFGGSATASAMTNPSGIATAPAMTANGQAGSYSVTVSAAGSSAAFSLTNLAGIPASISATAGASQTASVNNAFGSALQAVVKDAANNLVSGITVTFTAPGTGASASFSGSLNATAVTNPSGIATAPAMTANALAGSYNVTAGVVGVPNTASFRLTNTAAAAGGSGSISGSGDSSTGTLNLTSEGTTDWVHWGDAVLNRKSGVTPQISNYTLVGSGPVQSYSNDLRALSWTDGAPTVSGSNNDGLYVNFSHNGFSFTAPADTTLRNLKIHVGGWVSGGTLTAHLSDGSPNFVDTTTLASGQFDRNYTLTYSAASAGQTLTISWVMTSGSGNVTLNGAALSTAGPGISATAGTPQSATVNATFSTPLQATVKDATNSPLSGIAVTFTAPNTGASAAFGGLATATVITDANGVAMAPTLTANGQAGSYSLVATAGSGIASASFNLTNLAGPAASVTATAGTNQSAAPKTAFASALQATVMDSSSNPVSGVTVKFTAPATGTGAAFAGSATATVTTNANGIATAPALTANTQSGSYTVTATVTGVSVPASFNLTNLSGVPASVSATAGTLQGTAVTQAFTTPLQAVVKDVNNNLLSGVTVTFAAPKTGASAGFSGSVSATAITDSNGLAVAPALTANTQAGSYAVTATVAGVTVPASFNLTNLAGPAAGISATAGALQTAGLSAAFATALQATVKDANNNPVTGVTVTFTAPTAGATAAFSGSPTATAMTNASGIATSPTITANAQAGSYTVTASAPGAGNASFSLTNSVASAVPIKFVQGNTYNSMINVQSATVAFKAGNAAGNWIGVVIYGGNGANTFTITDTNGNTYRTATSFGSKTINTTLGVFYAENIKAGANTVKVIPNSGVYLRMIILEYSGIAAANSLDVAAAAQGSGTSLNSGKVVTTAGGDLILGTAITADASNIAVGPGFTAEGFVPTPTSGKLMAEDSVQTAPGSISASATLGAGDGWIMGVAAFKAAVH
jgi:hypothetical protein